MRSLYLLLLLAACAGGDPTPSLPAPCPDSEPVADDAVERDAARAWAAAVGGASVALDWSGVPSPQQDWSRWRWDLDEDLELRRVFGPSTDDPGACNDRVIALLTGTLSPVDIDLDFPADIELTLQGDQVLSLGGWAMADTYPHDDIREAWWLDVAATLDRSPTTDIPPLMHLRFRDHRAYFIADPLEPWFTPVVVAEGTVTLQPAPSER